MEPEPLPSSAFMVGQVAACLHRPQASSTVFSAVKFWEVYAQSTTLQWYGVGRS